MKTTLYKTTMICVLAEGDNLTDCPSGAYAVIEDCGFYVVLLVMGDDSWTVHKDPFLTLEDALDLIAERRRLFT